ncbi:MAG: excinuclease ABC subunit UvrC, partial [Patescibacteria group bacterium]
MNKIKNALRKLPSSSGVYQFLDSAGEIIYIGKAKVLKNRVKSYFQKNSKSPKIEKLVADAFDLRWLETNSEVEALTLEANLVKKFQPKFNALLRDDKHFLYFKITKEDFPQILAVRKIDKDGAKYFGPKTDSRAVRETIQLVQKLFRVRTCNLGICAQNSGAEVTKKTIKYPCLFAHINFCAAPCDSKICRDDYQKLVDAAADFLAGDSSKILHSLRNKMTIAALEKKFELAGQLRDQIVAIENSAARQLASAADLQSRDVVGVKIDGKKAYFALLQIRDGKLVDAKNFVFASGEGELAEILESFLTQFFEISTEIPPEILLPEKIENSAALEKWLAEKRGGRVQILFPQKGDKNNLLKLAEKNAAAFAVQNKAKFENASERTVGAARELAQKLGISGELKRIEAYDISHFAGDATVGSMVILENGEPKNSDYRHFKIRSLAKGAVDDFAALAEVLSRRMNYLVPQNSGIKIRRARKAETEQIFANSKLLDFETGEQLSRLPDFLVAEIDKKIVASAQIHEWKEAKIFGLYSVWVDPKFRGQKIGQLVVRELLRKTAAKKVYLNCIASLVDYYSELGFREIRSAPEFLENSIREFCRRNSEVKLFEQRFMVFEKRAQKVDSSFAAKPNLIVLDGGKGQLSTVLKNVQFPKNVAVIGLAKKFEEVFRVAANGKFEKIILPKNSQALFLLQRIRDEAHRFANSLRE